jgi:hypothetical protein
VVHAKIALQYSYSLAHSDFFAIMMQCKALSKTYLLLIILASVESLEITGNPQSVTNATVGGNATFECTLSSESASPSWNINGIDYQVTDLPFGYYFQSVSFSKRLIVNPVLKKMNNTSIFCFILNFNGRQESLPAKLIIIHELTTTTTTRILKGTHLTLSAKAMTLMVSQVAASNSATNTLLPVVTQLATPLVFERKEQFNHLDTSIVQVTAEAVGGSFAVIVLVTITSAAIIYHYEEVTVTSNPHVYPNASYARPTTIPLETNPAYGSTGNTVSPTNNVD